MCKASIQNDPSVWRGLFGKRPSREVFLLTTESDQHEQSQIIDTTKTTMTIATTVGITVAISVALLALLTAHHEQSNQIQELSRQLSEALELFEVSSASVVEDDKVLSRRTEEEVGSFTYASDFGVVGDSMANDGPALQAAIDSAAINASGGTVILPKGIFFTAQPLTIPGGVTLQGMGYGSSPLAIAFDAGGTTIAYCGTDHAVKITGSSSGLRDLAVYDWPYNHGEFDGGCVSCSLCLTVCLRSQLRYL